MIEVSSARGGFLETSSTWGRTEAKRHPRMKRLGTCVPIIPIPRESIEKECMVKRGWPSMVRNSMRKAACPCISWKSARGLKCENPSRHPEGGVNSKVGRKDEGFLRQPDLGITHPHGGGRSRSVAGIPSLRYNIDTDSSSRKKKVLRIRKAGFAFSGGGSPLQPQAGAQKLRMQKHLPGDDEPDRLCGKTASTRKQAI